jgi:four helix bundle protein
MGVAESEATRSSRIAAVANRIAHGRLISLVIATIDLASALPVVSGMGVKRLEDLDAFNLAVEFKLAVYSLVRRHRDANNDFRWRSQLFDAALAVESDIAEGWRRFRKREICQFFRYALASLEEAKRRLIDGVHRGHYSQSLAEPVLVLGRRCGAATMEFMKSLE